MSDELISPETFPYDRFLSVMEEKDRFMYEWAEGNRPHDVPVVIYPTWDMWNNDMCADRELYLRLTLQNMAANIEWASDGMFPHLEPWYGVGLYAAAFGSRYYWDPGAAPQTRPIFKSADEVSDITMPDPMASEPMQEVLDRIRWYREMTHDRLPICLTDTQSPNDTASLLMETNEFFLVSSYEPERVERFMNVIVDLIITFSEMQMEAIGPCLSLPGHVMFCHPCWSGISVSDDNMAFLSPKAYEVGCLPYNSRIAEHFGGIALHTCGDIAHNMPLQLRTPNLQQVESAVCVLVKDSDPCPNQPEAVRDSYRGTGILVKVRINKDEVDVLDRLLAPDLKCALAVTGVETREESERVYERFKERISRITASWPRCPGGELDPTDEE